MAWWDDIYSGALDLVSGGNYSKSKSVANSLNTGFGSATYNALGSQPNLLNPSGFTGSAPSSIPGYDPAKQIVTTPQAVVQANSNPANLSATQQAILGNVASRSDANKAMANGGAGGNLPAAGPAAASLPTNAPPSSPLQSATATNSYDAERLALAKQRQAQIDAAVAKINGLANPYDTNSDAFKGALAGAVNRTNRAMAGSEARANGALAGRGMLGSGYGAASAANLAAARGIGVSDTMNSMYSNALDHGARFGLDQQSAILQALGGGSLENTLADLQRQSTDQSRFDIGRQDMADGERNAVIGGIAKWAAEHPGEVTAGLRTLLNAAGIKV